MKIAIASLGRFHTLDLARELSRLGEDVTYYSYVPKERAVRFGLPESAHRSLLGYVAPLVAWQRYAAGVLPDVHEKTLAYALDAAGQAALEPCDVFICMPGFYNRTALKAKQRYSAKIWIERGSSHILSQRQMLAQFRIKGPTPFMIRRELEMYQLADRIVVPSSHVIDSFREFSPELASKLFVNPYGVDLEQFPQRAVPPTQEAPPTVIFVGGWSMRKGVDVLVDAIVQMGDVRLLHVGALVDAPFPNDPRFEHVDAVPQWRLKEYYARAHVFAMASREEGLALVQAQALAIGLPLVCTERTGGGDLAHSQGLLDRIRVVPINDAPSMAREIGRFLAKGSRWPAPLPPADRELLTWSAYAERYQRELHADRSQKTTFSLLDAGASTSDILR